MIQFQHAVFVSRLPHNSQDRPHDFSIKLELLENDVVLYTGDGKNNTTKSHVANRNVYIICTYINFFELKIIKSTSTQKIINVYN